MTSAEQGTDVRVPRKKAAAPTVNRTTGKHYSHLSANHSTTQAPNQLSSTGQLLYKLDRMVVNYQATQQGKDALEVLSSKSDIPPIEILEAFISQLFLTYFRNVDDEEFLSWQHAPKAHRQIQKERLLDVIPDYHEVVKYATVRRCAQEYFNVDLKEVSAAFRRIVAIVHDAMFEYELLKEKESDVGTDISGRPFTRKDDVPTIPPSAVRPAKSAEVRVEGRSERIRPDSSASADDPAWFERRQPLTSKIRSRSGEEELTTPPVARVKDGLHPRELGAASAPVRASELSTRYNHNVHRRTDSTSWANRRSPHQWSPGKAVEERRRNDHPSSVRSQSSVGERPGGAVDTDMPASAEDNINNRRLLKPLDKPVQQRVKVPPNYVVDSGIPSGTRMVGTTLEKSYHGLGVKRTWPGDECWLSSFELDDDDLSDQEDDVLAAEKGRRNIISSKQVEFLNSNYGGSEGARIAAEAFVFKIDKAMQADVNNSSMSDNQPDRIAVIDQSRPSKRVCRPAGRETGMPWRLHTVWNPYAHCASCSCTESNEGNLHCRTCLCATPSRLPVAARRTIKNGPDIFTKTLMSGSGEDRYWDSWLEELLSASDKKWCSVN